MEKFNIDEFLRSIPGYWYGGEFEPCNYAYVGKLKLKERYSIFPQIPRRYSKTFNALSIKELLEKNGYVIVLKENG